MRPISHHENLTRLREKCATDFFKKHQQKFIKVTCPACDKEGNFTFLKYGFSHDRCSSCKTVWTNPRPTVHLLTEYYMNSESTKLWTSILVNTDTARKLIQYQPRVDRLLKILQIDPSFTAKKAVDLGAGSGAFALCLQQANYFEEVLAVDFDKDCGKVCESLGLKTIVGSIEDLAKNSTDLISMNDMIEHLFDPKSFLELCYSSLRDNGYISIACPNGQGFDFRLMGKKTVNVTPPEHLNYFNPDSLAHLLSCTGFQVVSASTPGILDIQIIKREFESGNLNLDDYNFVKDLLLQKNEVVLNEFQGFLQKTKQSSHMVIVAKKQTKQTKQNTV